MKYIKRSKDNNYIVVVLTINIENDFYNVFHYREDSAKLCITMYHTASRFLDCIIEFTNGALLKNYHLFIDEAHLLLLHHALIEMTLVFNYVGLIIATPRKLKQLSGVYEHTTINPSITTHHQKKLFTNKLKSLSLQYNKVNKLVKKNINKYNFRNSAN